MATEPIRSDHALEDVFDKAVEQTEGDSVSLGDLLDLFGDRSFGPILILLGLATVVPPLGGVPGLPAVVGVAILFFSIQMLWGARHIWLPDAMRSLSISKDKLAKANDRSRRALAVVDGLVTDRLVWAVSRPARYGAGVLVSVLALALIPLELVPFAVAIPGLAITLTGLALTARDGALMLAAFALSAAAFGVLIAYTPNPF